MVGERERVEKSAWYPEIGCGTPCTIPALGPWLDAAVHDRPRAAPGPKWPAINDIPSIAAEIVATPKEIRRVSHADTPKTAPLPSESVWQCHQVLAVAAAKHLLTGSSPASTERGADRKRRKVPQAARGKGPRGHGKRGLVQ